PARELWLVHRHNAEIPAVVYRLRVSVRRIPQMRKLRCIAFAFVLSCLYLNDRSPSGLLHGATANARSNGSTMEPLLRARKSVSVFFEQSANVVCGESITQI